MNEETNVNETPAAAEETVAEQAKTYTQEEVDAMLQQETDRRVTAAMKKAERKQQAAVREAEKLARLNQDERYQYELEQREKAIADKERQLAIAENKAQASAILAERGISSRLVDLVVAEDADTMLENINHLDAEFKASVKLEVEKRLATSTPKKNLPTDKPITRQEFSKMKLTEQAALFEQNPELYKQLAI